MQELLLLVLLFLLLSMAMQIILIYLIIRKRLLIEISEQVQKGGFKKKVGSGDRALRILQHV